MKIRTTGFFGGGYTGYVIAKLKDMDDAIGELLFAGSLDSASVKVVEKARGDLTSLREWACGKTDDDEGAVRAYINVKLDDVAVEMGEITCESSPFGAKLILRFRGHLRRLMRYGDTQAESRITGLMLRNEAIARSKRMSKFLKPSEDCDAECQKMEDEMPDLAQFLATWGRHCGAPYPVFRGHLCGLIRRILADHELKKERIAEEVARGVPFELGRALGRKKANQKADLKKAIEGSAQEKETPEERAFLEWWNEGKQDLDSTAEECSVESSNHIQKVIADVNQGGWFGRNKKDEVNQLTLPEVLIAAKAELSDLDETMARIESGLHGAYGEWETEADLATEVRGNLQRVWKWLDLAIQDANLDKFAETGREAWKDVSKTASEWVEELRGKA